MLDIFFLIFLFLVGLSAGTLGSIIGVGGGIIITPVLTLLGLPPSTIASTSIFAVTASSISSNISYSKKNLINYKIGIKIGIFSIPGAVLGAIFSNYVSNNEFKIYFAVLLIVTGIYIIIKNKITANKRYNRDKDEKRRNFLFIYCISFFAGIVSSFFGVGGGIIFVPILLMIMQMNMINASPTSQFIILISSIVGVISHSILQHPAYDYVIPLMLGSVLGAQIGVRLFNVINERFLRIIFGIVLISVAVKFIVDVIHINYQ